MYSSHQTSQPRFTWQRGSWFGGQIGASAWLLAGALHLISTSPPVALAWLRGSVVIYAFGFWLWSKQSQLSVFAGVQMLLMAAGLIGMLAWAYLLKVRPGIPSAEQWPTGYWQFAIVPMLMAWLAVLHRR